MEYGDRNYGEGVYGGDNASRSTPAAVRGFAWAAILAAAIVLLVA
jgi:hypothetical protein